MTFGEKCRLFRQEKGFTQQAVADAVNISKRTYLYYEKNKKLPRKRETIQNLADLFGVDFNQLFVENDERFLELMNQRPAQERIDSVLDNVRSLLEDRNIDFGTKRVFADKLRQLCALADTAPDNTIDLSNINETPDADI